MTREELEFWGQPPYQVTLTNNVGHPLGTLSPDGTFIECGASNVGKVSRGDPDYVVSWDGSKPDPMPGGSTKGRLLPVKGPRYIDSLVAIGFYKRSAADQENLEYETNAPTERLKRYAQRQAQKNRAKGQPNAA